MRCSSWRPRRISCSAFVTTTGSARRRCRGANAASQVDGRALVFVENSGPYLLHLNPFSRNSADLTGPILYATDRGFENLDLITRHPERTAYVEWSDVPRDTSLGDPKAPVPKITVDPVTVINSHAYRVHVRLTNYSDAPIGILSFRVGAQEIQTTLSTDAQPNQTFEADVTLTTSTADAGAPNTFVVPEPGGSLIIRAGFASAADQVFPNAHYRQRYDFAVKDGTISVMMPGRDYIVQPFEGSFVYQRITDSPLTSTFVPLP